MPQPKHMADLMEQNACAGRSARVRELSVVADEHCPGVDDPVIRRPDGSSDAQFRIVVEPEVTGHRSDGAIPDDDPGCSGARLADLQVKTGGVPKYASDPGQSGVCSCGRGTLESEIDALVAGPVNGMSVDLGKEAVVAALEWGRPRDWSAL